MAETNRAQQLAEICHRELGEQAVSEGVVFCNWGATQISATIVVSSWHERAC
jgi:hypothetical protein